MKNNCYIKLLFSGLFVLAGFAFCGWNDDPADRQFATTPNIPDTKPFPEARSAANWSKGRI